jgi:hypothetical protein
MKMDNKFTVSIDEATGDTKFLVNDLSRGLVDETSRVQRASHVEPYSFLLRLFFHGLRIVFGEDGRIGDWTRNWNCYWRVNLAPVGGPTSLVAIKPRMYAINAEVDWLNENFL